MTDLATMMGAGDVSTFLGVPACADVATCEAKVAIVGAPCITPYASVGAYCAGAPAAIRAASRAYSAISAHVNFDLGGPAVTPGMVVDLGDLPGKPETGEENRARLRETVRALRARGAVPVVLGGDDSTPIPLIEALDGEGPLTIILIDAHIDFRDLVQGERWGLSSNMRRASEMAHVERILLVGQRGIGSARPEEVEAARAWGAQFFGGERIAREGIAPVLDAIPEGARVVVALDCDGLDPSVMPAVIARTPGGLGYWDVIGIIRGAAEKGRVVGFDIAEFMPERDVDGQGATLAAQLVLTTCGLLAAQE